MMQHDFLSLCFKTINPYFVAPQVSAGLQVMSVLCHVHNMTLQLLLFNFSANNWLTPTTSIFRRRRERQELDLIFSIIYSCLVIVLLNLLYNWIPVHTLFKNDICYWCTFPWWRLGNIFFLCRFVKTERRQDKRLKDTLFPFIPLIKDIESLPPLIFIQTTSPTIVVVAVVCCQTRLTCCFPHSFCLSLVCVKRVELKLPTSEEKNNRGSETKQETYNTE